MDGMNQGWSMPIDVPMATPSLDGQPQTQQGANAFNSPGGLFMGGDGPGNMPM